MEELLKQLAKPMEFKWRVQQSNQYGANMVAYVDARQVQDRFDEVLGLDWSCSFEEVKGNVYCTIGIFREKWIHRSDCGTESNVEKEKGEASDAFKRAAVMWGVGRFLYKMPPVKMKTVQVNGKWYPTKDGKNPLKTREINKYCHEELKRRYKS